MYCQDYCGLIVSTRMTYFAVFYGNNIMLLVHQCKCVSIDRMQCTS
jgi:hypothetical protein